MKQKTIQALKWIVTLLEQNKIPFHITGGLAAKLYGSPRPLYDIDLEVPEKYFPQLSTLVDDKIIFGPKRYNDGVFDVLLITLEYSGQKIDISGYGSEKNYNKSKKRWESFSNADNTVIIEVFNIKFPVIVKPDLIAYKKKIGRPTDLVDIEAITKADNKFNNVKNNES